MTVSTQMIALCRMALCGGQEVPFDRPNDGQMAELYSLSAHHDMAHLVSYALYRLGWLDVASEVGAHFQKAQMIAVFRYEQQRAELEALSAALEQAGIEHLPLKGSEIRALYPEPWMRTSADIDVLVRAEALDRAIAVLTDTLGYRREVIGGEHDVSFRTPNNVHIELHFDLIEEGRVGSVENELHAVWSATHAVEGKAWRRAMDDDMFYFYHLAHMAKHFAGGGCGIRTFADLWMLDHRIASDAEARRARIERGGLTTFEATAKQVSEMWFSAKEGDDLTRRMAVYVLQGGTFGDSVNYVSLQHAAGKRGLAYALERIFMPYEQLCMSYPSLKGRRYLLFFYQIRRLVRGVLRGKLRGGVRELRLNRTMEQTQVDATARLLKELDISPACKEEN